MKNKNAELYNPCLKEQNLTYKCYDRNNYDREKCFFEIENYKACKKFWGEVSSFRRRQGIKPLLPPVEEREKIREEYLTKKNKQN
ncbi:hypothetical protein GWI33_018294 [Rhynchophorus ferrugineus]|uniref:Coiled-coil-helix-coiled-coil-helix domain-containing protein 7 n=1 Tax=Rhynchophorus ferrugineus TaxID=354439 RepID=A0A834M899_RHYFE|nr:hypothetical protein GWI33_018294 [Rhynchophorus ferrugineus]